MIRSINFKKLRAIAKLRRGVLLVSYLVSAHAGAATTNVNQVRYASKERISREAIVESLKSLAVENQSRAQGSLRFESMGYLTEIPETPQLTNSQMLSAHFNVDKISDWLHNHADISAGSVTKSRNSHLVVSEIYTSSRQDLSNSRLYFGRVKMNWSFADQDFQLGLWQPKFAIDTLRPIDQGLTGLFYVLNEERFSLDLFVTPLFVPSMGPDIQEKNGSLVSDSRWYRTPQAKFPFRNKETPIVYSLDIPEVANLVRHSGYALSFGWNKKLDVGTFAIASAAYKPVNQLVMKYQSFLSLPENSQPVGDVTVSPDVTYHNLKSIDVGYKSLHSQVTASVIQDDPEFSLPSEGWVQQKLDPIRLASLSLKTELPLGNKYWEIGVGNLKVNGGRTEDLDSRGVVQGAILPHRLSYYDAIQVSLNGKLPDIWRRPLTGKFSYLFDRQQQARLIQTEVQFKPHPQFGLILGADVLGPDDENDTTSGFLNQYRANDRVYGGMNYVF